MPRTPLTRADRIQSVHVAVEDLPRLYRTAFATEAAHGPTDPRTLLAWERVETAGATIHRQARLLAGKSRGG